MAKFIPFLVAGDPNLEISEKVVDLFVEEGAALIELGVPFSDALADGPVIQAASERAAHRVSLQVVLDFAEKMLNKHPGFPFVLFTYYNPILKMGLNAFSERAKKIGIHAVLVVDLPPEEAGNYVGLMKKNSVGTVFLASPTTSPERLKKIEAASTAFIYYVSRTGVTGVQNEVSATLELEFKKIKALTSLPLAVGFGISNGAQARQVSRFADSVVVGSALVKLIADLKPPLDLEPLRKLVKELKWNID